MKTPQELAREEQDPQTIFVQEENYLEQIHIIIEKAVREAINTGSLCSKGGELVYREEQLQDKEYLPLSTAELEIIFAYLRNHLWNCQYRLYGKEKTCTHKLILTPIS